MHNNSSIDNYYEHPTMSEKKGSIQIKTEPNEVVEIAVKEPSSTVQHGGPTLSRGSVVRKSGDLSHVLTSIRKGESDIETLAKKIETRRANRIPVPFSIRKLFLQVCRDAAKAEGQVNRLSKGALVKLRCQYRENVEGRADPLSKTKNFTGKLFGFWDKEIAMLELLDAACDMIDQLDTSWFFFRDFNYYNTVVANRIRLFRSPVVAASVYLLMFYLGSAILFCPIMKDDNVCPDRDSYDGWLTSVYFASVTMSTVGYGDVSLAGEGTWRTFIGTIYMLVSMIFAYFVFSTAASAAIDKAQIDRDSSSDNNGSIFQRIFGMASDDMDLPLYQRVRRVTAFRVFELLFWFFCLNFLGMFVALGFVSASDVEGQQWNWMTSFYWAVQTTTTIGYGDLNMPFDMRWFNIFFTTFGTAFVGAVFGAAAGLKDEVADMRRYYAWKRREVSKQLIDDMQGSSADEKVDQYEFMVASLLMLNKINGSDVEKIMDKYRELAGDKGFILAEDLVQEGVKNAERDDQNPTAAEDEDMKCEIDG